MTRFTFYLHRAGAAVECSRLEICVRSIIEETCQEAELASKPAVGFMISADPTRHDDLLSETINGQVLSPEDRCGKAETTKSAVIVPVTNKNSGDSSFLGLHLQQPEDVCPSLQCGVTSSSQKLLSPDASISSWSSSTISVTSAPSYERATAVMGVKQEALDLNTSQPSVSFSTLASFVDGESTSAKHLDDLPERLPSIASFEKPSPSVPAKVIVCQNSEQAMDLSPCSADGGLAVESSSVTPDAADVDTSRLQTSVRNPTLLGRATACEKGVPEKYPVDSPDDIAADTHVVSDDVKVEETQAAGGPRSLTEAELLAGITTTAVLQYAGMALLVLL